MTFLLPYLLLFLVCTGFIVRHRSRLQEALHASASKQRLAHVQQALRQLLMAYAARTMFWILGFVAAFYVTHATSAPWMAFLFGVAAMDDLRKLIDLWKSRDELDS